MALYKVSRGLNSSYMIKKSASTLDADTVYYTRDTSPGPWNKLYLGYDLISDGSAFSSATWNSTTYQLALGSKNGYTQTVDMSTSFNNLTGNYVKTIQHDQTIYVLTSGIGINASNPSIGVVISPSTGNTLIKYTTGVSTGLYVPTPLITSIDASSGSFYTEDTLATLNTTTHTLTFGANLVYETAGKDPDTGEDITGHFLNLRGVNNGLISSVDCSAFIKDGMLQDVSLVTNPAGYPAGTYIKFIWNTDASTPNASTYLNVTSLVDIYTSNSSAISVSNYKIGFNLSATDTYHFLKVNSGGLYFDSSIFWDTRLNGILLTPGTNTSIYGSNINASTLDISAGTSTVAYNSSIPAGTSIANAFSILIKGINAAASTGGVTSFGGKKGDIGISSGSTTNGAINFTMGGTNSSILSASVYGLNTAAYIPSSSVVKYADTSWINVSTNANNALQTFNISTGKLGSYQNEYISVVKSERNASTWNVSLAAVIQDISTASVGMTGLVDASNAKTYILSQITANQLQWQELT